MKKIILFVGIIALMLALFTVAVGATENTSESISEKTETTTESTASAETEATTESMLDVSTPIETESGAVEDVESDTETTTDIVLDSNIAAEIIEIIENAGSKSDVVLAIVARFGCTPEEAEEILNTFIALGDKYLGDNATWIGFKKDIQENTQFWVMVITCGVAVLALIAVVFILIGRTNPTMRRAMFGMSESLKISSAIAENNLTVLNEMKADHAKAIEKEEEYKKIIEDKEDQILTLGRHIKTLKTAIKKERSNMLIAEMYNLRMLKLVLDRTSMPVADKSTIDHWYAKGIDAIKEELSPEDIDRAEKMLSTLDTVGGCNEDKAGEEV